MLSQRGEEEKGRGGGKEEERNREIEGFSRDRMYVTVERD